MKISDKLNSAPAAGIWTQAGRSVNRSHTLTRFLGGALLVAMVYGTAGSAAAAPRSAPGELLVTYTPPAVIGRSQATDPVLAQATARGLRSTQLLGGLSPSKSRSTRSGTSASEVVTRLVFPEGNDISAISASLMAIPGVRRVEPNYLGSLCYAPSGNANYASQSGDLALIGMEAGWQAQITAGGSAGASSSVKVAVIDSGIDITHPDLSSAVDTANSYNFAAGNATVADDLGHGTRVAGIIGATNNSIGIAGVAFGCKLLSLDVVDSSGTVSTANVLSAVNWATNHGANVINMSIRFDGLSQNLADACDNAAANGIILVAAAGNENQGDAIVYPAGFDSVLGVGAVTDNGNTRASFSNYNGVQHLVDLVAPGTTVYSTIPDNQYNGTYGSGTSYAAPYVSGVAALLATKYPSQSGNAIAAHLKATAVAPVGFLPANSYGSGRLSAQSALEQAMLPNLALDGAPTIDDSTAISVSNNADGTLDKGETVRLVIPLANTRADATGVSALLSSTSPDVTITSATATWPGILNGHTGSNSLILQLNLAATASVQTAAFNLAVSANSGAYTANLPFSISTEAEIPVVSPISAPTVWTAGNTYVLNGQTNVNSNLTIQPGTHVRAKPGAHLEILGGAFSAQGSSALPIAFLPYGGDTNPSLIDTDLEWATSAGSADSEQAFGVAQFTDGSVAVTGTFRGSATFGSGATSQTLSSFGNFDVFLAKYTPAGNLQWVRRAGSAAGDESGRAIVAMSDGGVVIAGSFAGTSTFSESPLVTIDAGNVAAGSTNPFFARYNASGALLWVKKVNCTGTNTTSAYAVSQFTSNGDLAIGGNFCGTATFGPGEAFPVSFTTSGRDAFVIRCNGTTGNLIWANRVAGSPNSLTNGVCTTTDGTDQVVAAGDYNQTGTFGPGVSYTANLGGGGNSSDLFVARYTSAGALVWAKGAGGGSVDSAAAVKCAPDGTSYVCGFFRSTGTVGSPSPNTTATAALFGSGEPNASIAIAAGNVQAFGGTNNDVFVAQVDQNGLLVWLKTAGGINHDAAYSLDLLSDGALTVGGSVCGPATFGNGEANQTIASSVSTNLEDAYVAEYQPSNGSFVSIKTWGSTNQDFAQSIAAGPGRSIAVAGYWNRLTVPTSANTMTFGANEARETVLSSLGNPDIFVAKLYGAPSWKGVTIRSGASSAALSNCVFERGGVTNELAGTTIQGCAFNRSGKDGLLSSAGSAGIGNCTADNDRFSGLVLGNRDATTCTVTNVRRMGISTSGTLNNCVAAIIGGDGLSGNGITLCSATDGRARGLVSTNGITNSTALRNSGAGATCTNGNVTNVVSELNGGTGISISNGTASNCTASQNGAGGISTNGSTVQNCAANANTGTGVTGSGVSALSGSVVRGNTAGISGVATVQNSVIEGNSSGLSGATTVSGSYVVNNSGTSGAISGGAVSDSTVVGNQSPGVRGASTLSNSWIVENTGVGIDGGLAYSTVVNNCTIKGNLGGGVKNLSAAGIGSSNLYGNSVFDAFDDQSRSGSQTKNFRNNFWGTTITALMNMPANAFPNANISPYIVDGFDSASGWFLDYTSNTQTQVANAPGTAAPAFLLSATPNMTSSPGVGPTTFLLTFSKAMNTSINPVVTFGVQDPYTLWTVNASPGWLNATTWQGAFNIQTTTGDGLNTMRVSGATDVGGFVIPDDVRVTFVVSGSASAHNGIVIITSGATIGLDWGARTAPLNLQGYNVARTVTNTTQDFVQLNSSLVYGTTFTDTTAQQGVTYTYLLRYRDLSEHDNDLALSDPASLLAPTAAADWNLFY